MSKELVTINQDAVAELRALTGENNGGGNFESYPVLEVNNKSTEKEVDIDGTMTLVKVPPEKLFTVTVKNAAGEYEKSPFVGEFEGVILKVRYEVDKKYSESDKSPWFTSREFDSFFDDLSLYTKEGTIWSGSYKDFKVEYEGRYTLYLVLYVSIDGKIYKTKFKGQSRSNFWDYMKLTKKDGGSVASQTTLFALAQEDSPVGKFNAVKYIKSVTPVNIEDTLQAARALTMALDSFKKKEKEEDIEAEVGEVVDFV